MIIHKKKVNVTFHQVDDSPFDEDSYRHIRINGCSITALQLVHCAAIHFQSRFERKLGASLSSFLTIFPSLIKDNREHFYFEKEEAELQKTSTEVIAVGFAISLFQKLLNVNYNCFSKIQGSGKRCDYDIFRFEDSFILEVKGRSRDKRRAIREIRSQKRGAQNVPKYGCITMLKRPREPAHITVIDPPSKKIDKSNEQRIIDLLIYYTKAVQLCGYYRLAEEINKRINEMLANTALVHEYNNIPIEYGNVSKMGYGIDLLYRGYDHSTFLSGNNEIGFRKIVTVRDKRYLMIFGISNDLIRILEQQRLFELLEYSFEMQPNLENNSISIQNDGTSLALINIEALPLEIK